MGGRNDEWLRKPISTVTHRYQSRRLRLLLFQICHRFQCARQRLERPICSTTTGRCNRSGPCVVTIGCNEESKIFCDTDVVAVWKTRTGGKTQNQKQKSKSKISHSADV